MPKRTAPSVRPTYGKQIRALRKGADILFFPASQNSIKAIASRIGAIKGRDYITRKEGVGVRVWRLT